MRRITLLLSPFTLMALLGSSAAQATLFEGDLHSSGDSLITIDTETGHEWLDVTATILLSVNEIVAGAGGYAEIGFRHATNDEVETLFENAGITSLDGFFDTAQYQGAALLIDLLGCTGVCQTGAPALNGFSGLNEIAAGSVSQPRLRADHGTLRGLAAGRENCCDSFDAYSANVGHFLLRPEPEPPVTLSGQLVAHGFSMSFAPASTSAGSTIFFTSFDNSTEPPLADCDSSLCFFSGEFKPTSAGSRTYRTDYSVQDSVGIFEDGTATLTISTSDGDGDGLPDALELERNGNFSLSGTAVPHWNAFDIYVNSSVSGSVSRSAGSRTGTYQGTLSNSIQSATFSGQFGLSGATGTVSYEIGDSTLDWDLAHRGIDGSTRNVSGVSQLVRNGTDEILIPSFTLSNSSTGFSITTQTATLNRFGNVFRGIVSVVDGEPLTSWPDYQQFLVEFTDPNDTNSDGLPDISFVSDETCGNGFVDTSVGESCDDGNSTGGDGCSESCVIESGFLCSGRPSVCAEVDTDGDGTVDNSDAFPSDPAEDTDTDSDGTGDNTDTDDDGDGLSDAIEASLGTNPLNADTDGDGTDDGVELASGTDPIIPSFTVTSTADDGGVGTLRWAIEQANAASRNALIMIDVGSDQTITLIDVPAHPLPLEIDQALTLDSSLSAGLTITCATARTSFNINQPGTIFRNISLVSLGGFSRASDLTFDQDRYDGEVSAAITGSGGIIKTGDRQLTLSGSNSYSGTTLLSAGTLVVTTEAIKNSNVDLDSGTTLVFSQDNNGVYDLQIKEVTGITGVANLLKQGTGTVTLDRPSVSANSWSGTTVIEDGTLLIRESGNSGLGGLPVGANVTLSNPTSTLQFDSDAGVLAIPQVYSGIASGAGSLVKSGVRVFELTGANTYTGGTTVDGGTFTINNTTRSSVPTAGGISVSSGAVLNVDTMAAAFSFSHNVSGEGSLTKRGANLLTLSGTNTYSGGTAVNDGDLVGTTSSIPGSVTLGTATTLTFNQSFAGTNSGNITGEGRLIKKGAGSVSLTGANSYYGADNFLIGPSNTVVEEGELVVTTWSLPTLPAAPNVGTTIFDAEIQDDATLTFSQSPDGAWGGVITNGGGTTGKVVKRGSGSVTFTENQFYTGSTSVTEGMLVLGEAIDQMATTGFGVSGSGNLQVLGYTDKPIDVDSGGSLSGWSVAAHTGLGGVVRIRSGGRLAPGNRAQYPRSLFFFDTSELTFQSGSVFAVTIADEGRGDYVIADGETIIEPGAALEVTVESGDYSMAPTATVFDNTGSTQWRFGTFSFSENYAFLDVSVDQAIGFIQVTVPEPSPHLAIATALLTLLTIRRRHR